MIVKGPGREEGGWRGSTVHSKRCIQSVCYDIDVLSYQVDNVSPSACVCEVMKLSLRCAAIFDSFSNLKII